VTVMRMGWQSVHGHVQSLRATPGPEYQLAKPSPYTRHPATPVGEYHVTSILWQAAWTGLGRIIATRTPMSMTSRHAAMMRSVGQSVGTGLTVSAGLDSATTDGAGGRMLP
jgi:hypothetical protein